MATSVRPSFPSIDSPPGSYLVCEAGAAGPTVFADVDVVRRLEMEAIAAFTALPKRGMEIGGVLLGRTEDDRTLIIKDYEPIPSEHRRGPSYLLSETDKRLFRERILHWRTAGRLRVIGLYRSNTRSGLAPVEEDVTLLAEHSPAGPGLFLLVQPALGRPSTARLFVGNDRGDKGFEFPLRRSGRASERLQAVAARGPVVCSAPVASVPPTQPLPESAEAAEAAAEAAEAAEAVQDSGASALTEQALESKESRTRRTTFESVRPSWLATVAAVPILAAGLFGLQLWRSSSRSLEASPNPIDLSVAWSDGSLHLRWDRNSSQILRAKRGIVWIVDGQRRQLMILDSRQLLQGSIQYWPQCRDVEFQLQLVTDAYRTSQSVTAAHIPEPVLSGPQATIPNVLAGGGVFAESQGIPVKSGTQPPIAAAPGP